jgi:hypothetical protein
MINKIIAILLGLILVVFIIVIVIPLIILTILQNHFNFRSANRLLEIIKGVNKNLYTQIIKFAKTKQAKKKSIVSLIDPRIQAIKDLPDFIVSEGELLPEQNIVVYYEPHFSPLINEYIQQHKDKIQTTLTKKGLDFLYLGDLDTIDLEDATDIISYYFPQLNPKNITSSGVSEIKETLLRDNIIGNLFRGDILDNPCFIKLKKRNEKEYNYSVYYLPEETLKEIEGAINHYLWVVTPPYDERNQGIQYRKSKFSIDDDEIKTESLESSIEVSSGFKRELEALLLNNGKVHTLKTMLSLIEKVSPERLGLEGKMLSILNDLHTNIQPKISQLIISPVGGIYLKDYNIEVKLTPLQKTVYLFFLSKPSGIFFKDLPIYKKELLEIYSRISSRTDLESLRSSIDELANPYSNSMSEKCSRIKEAFLKQIDDEWARYYYISGERNEQKVIKLDRNKVVFEESNY